MSIAFLFPDSTFGDFMEFMPMEGKIKEDGGNITIIGHFRPNYSGVCDVTYTVRQIRLPGQKTTLKLWAEFEKWQWASATIEALVDDECFMDSWDDIPVRY